MEDFLFGDFAEQIREIYRKRLEEKERALTEIIERYDFLVGSKDVMEMLKTILPEGANIVCSKYVEDPTAVYAIKRFDMMDYFSVKMGDIYE